jgi:hypothetical protein
VSENVRTALGIVCTRAPNTQCGGDQWDVRYAVGGLVLSRAPPVRLCASQMITINTQNLRMDGIWDSGTRSLRLHLSTHPLWSLGRLRVVTCGLRLGVIDSLTMKAFSPMVHYRPYLRPNARFYQRLSFVFYDSATPVAYDLAVVLEGFDTSFNNGLEK